MPISLPRLDIPHIVHGSNGGGVGRGDGQDGDIIQKGNPNGKKGNAGNEEGEGIIVSIDMEEIYLMMEEELKLPDLKPKPNEVMEEEEIKYNNISKTGPESLRHNRRTMLQAMKRQAASGDLDKLHWIPGFDEPVKLITPINSDKRYRQYNIIKKPSSNAVIFFARDGSGSVDQYRCDIISDMCFWIDLWIRRFYKRVERCYVWHDVVAQEVDAEKFYKYRAGGGTKCSSALKYISQQFDSRFPPHKWNFYVFYFTDGENTTYPQPDNLEFVQTLKESYPEAIVNQVCITQVMSVDYKSSVKAAVDDAIRNGEVGKNVVTAAVEPPLGYSGWGVPNMSEEERNEKIKKAIVELLGTTSKNSQKVGV